MEREDANSSDWQESETPKEGELTAEDYQQLIIQLRKTNVQFQQMCNIPSGELTMLITLRILLFKKKFVIPSDIGETLRLSRPAVSRMIHNLERKGYLQMKESAQDHRNVMVEFTSKGRNLIKEEIDQCCILLKKVAKRMGEKDMRMFLHYYNKFSNILAEEFPDSRGR